MFILQLFIMMKNWKHPQGASVEDRLSKLMCIQTARFYAAI